MTYNIKISAKIIITIFKNKFKKTNKNILDFICYTKYRFNGKLSELYFFKKEIFW
jgi:hypothetical protein